MRLAGTILAAKPFVPMRDSSSRFVQEDCCSQEVRASLSSLSLTSGRRASNRSVSRRMPRYSRYVSGVVLREGDA